MKFSYITEKKQLENIIPILKAEKYLYLDTEVAVKNFKNIDFFSDKVRLIQIGTEKDIFVIDIFKIGKENINILKPILEEKGLIGHNLKFDIKFLKTNFDIFPKIVFDTMIASQIISEGKDTKHSLLAVSKREADLDLDKSQQKSPWHLTDLLEEQIKYAANDIEALRQIFPSLKEKLNQMKTPHKATGETKEIFGVENPVAAVEFTFIPNLALIELKGMPIDKNLLDKMLKQLSSEYQSLYIDFFRKYGIDPFSPQKVANWLTNKLKLKLPKTEKGSISSQDKYLRKYENKPEVQKLIEIRTKKKLLDKVKELNEYITPDLEDENTGRIRSLYRQIGAPTGRMSSSKPNLQNIPPVLRKLFRPAKNYSMIVADYSQIELRIAAEYTKDQVMINAFKQGLDLHRFTASLITGKDYEDITKEERQMAKAINFGLIYGISPRSLMEYASSSYGVEISLKEAQIFHEKFFEHYKGFKKWHEETKEKLKNHREIEVVSLLGRRMKVMKFTDAVNYPIQATGSDMLKMAVNFFGKLKKDLDAYIVNLVHDEIIVEAKEDIKEEAKAILEESMKKAGEILLKNVPIKYEIEIVTNWSEK
ncbi:bifunctional 3'-5' exonuclease/DNA polymerase [Hydrogenothermus marinus]|uniref:DNA polymerase I n=1 Tax=Hydrogenothermus marinus TaxID=133270 RepID=A0A3M0BSX4_9AQUI|nr:bifunctional 3'-5' exonuclease/DNA polymerase [Hydrogenothermus marinus]RMA97918.1 DNA polymerase-1 [Hydrogenothermus marinus]